ncbi:putative ferric-chelate reductase 1, partial [Clarias magur]
MGSRLIAVVVFLCTAWPLTEAQMVPVASLNTSITNTTCRTSKLCVSSVTYCDPAGNSSCFFSSTQYSNGVLTVEISGTTSGYVALGLAPATPQTQILTQGYDGVFVCGNNNTNAFLETAFRYKENLYPVYLPTVNITSVQGSVTGNQSLNQSRTQCAFNIDLKSTFLTATLQFFTFPTLLNSTLLNLTPFNSTLSSILSSTLLNSSPFNSTIIPLLNSTLINPTVVNYTLLSLVSSDILSSTTFNDPILKVFSYARQILNPYVLDWSLLRGINYILFSDLGNYLNSTLFNSTVNSDTINSATQFTVLTLLSSTLQNSPFSNYTVRDLLNSTLLSVPAQLPFNITILTGTTNGTQLGIPSTVFSSNGPLDLANPRSNVPAPMPLNITRNGCKSTKLCLSEAQDCDPAGTGSCFFTSVRLTDQTFFFELSGTTSGYVALALTKNGVTTVFACGSNNYLFFFQPATQNGTTLTPATVNTVYNAVGVVSQSQTLIQCVFNTSASFSTSTKSADTSYQVTILNGTTNGTQLGSANLVYDSKKALDLSNPLSGSSSLSNRLISIFCTN